MKRKDLKTWASQAAVTICRTFARFQMRVKVRRVDFGPALVRFTIAQGQSHKVNDVTKHEADVAQALRVDPGQTSIVQTARGLVLSIPSPAPYVVGRADLDPGRGLAIPLGVAADGGRTYHLRFSEVVTNLLIVAPTRSGKTTLLRTLVYGLAAQNSERKLQLALVDLKDDSMLAGFSKLAHLRYPIATRPADAVAVLQDLADEVTCRTESKSRRPAHIFLIVDELIGLVQDRQYGAVATEALNPILTRGGGLGIYTIATTQRADKRSLSDPLIASQFVHRLVGRVASGQESALASGRAGMNCHKLLGKGDFVALVDSEVTRVQIAPTPDELVDRLPTASIAPIMPELGAQPKPRGPGRPPEEVRDEDAARLRDAGAVRSLRGVREMFKCGNERAKRLAERAGRLDLLPEGSI